MLLPILSAISGIKLENFSSPFFWESISVALSLDVFRPHVKRRVALLSESKKIVRVVITKQYRVQPQDDVMDLSLIKSDRVNNLWSLEL